MRNLINLLFFTLVFLEGKGQVNLVPNPSFEDTLYCPFEYGQIAAAKYWYSPNQGSTDYFNSCAEIELGIPVNQFGFQIPKTGFAYAGWGVAFDSINLNSREYLEIELSQTLNSNTYYIVSANMSLANPFPIALKGFGIALSDNPTSGSQGTTIETIPQVIYPQFLIDTLNWIEVSDTILATGNEKYLTIGYFKNNNVDDTLNLFISENWDKYAYYYVDDVSVKKLSSIGIDESVANEFNIFVNDNAIEINGANNCKVQIFNSFGQTIEKFVIPPTGNFSFSTINIAKGLLFISLSDNNSIINKKIFIH